MALKSWSLPDCQFRLLGGGSWYASGTGVSEYYFNPDPSERLSAEPNGMVINGAPAVKGDIGTLTAGEYNWGDANSLGFNTLYVRLPGDENPTSKPAEYVKCSEPVEVMQVSADVSCFLLSMLVSNFSQTDDANIWIYHTDASDVIKFKWVIDLLATNSPFALDSTIVLEAQDKIKIMASIEDVAMYISGDET